MGVDSTAVLVLWARTSIVPDLILFADLGAKSPTTYAYRQVIDRFLERVGFPPIAAASATAPKATRMPTTVATSNLI